MVEYNSPEAKEMRKAKWVKRQEKMKAEAAVRAKEKETRLASAFAKLREARDPIKVRVKTVAGRIRRVPVNITPRKLKVMSEWQTLYQVLQGKSLSRYGDGELKHMAGKRNVSQVFFPNLQERLIEVYDSRLPNHIVGIPNVYNGRVFTEVDGGYIDSMYRKFSKISDPEHLYGSSYITRGDLFPAFSWPSYWSVVSLLWTNRDVVLVRGHEKRANSNMMCKSKSLMQIETPQSHAWVDYQRILNNCMMMNPAAIYLLCIGPTATVLAYDLARQGRWAVDIGHLGIFYRKLGVEDPELKQVWNHRPTDPGYIKGVTDQC